MITENIPTLKINKLTQEQYNREYKAGNISETAMYLIPDTNILSPDQYGTELPTSGTTGQLFYLVTPSVSGGENKTVELAITNGEYSTSSYSEWVASNTLYAGRDGNGTYWFSMLSFSIGELNDISKSSNLVLQCTIDNEDSCNPYGTSAIVTASELTPSQVHALTTESAVTAVDGYIAHTNCTSHTTSGVVNPQTAFSYTISTDKLKANTTYYIYLKRRIGWANDSSTSTNGWTRFDNPATTGAANSFLTLTYEALSTTTSGWCSCVPYIYTE